MSSSSPPPSDQHTTVLFETPQSTLADISPTSSSAGTPHKKALKDCTWVDIAVSAEATNSCVRKPTKYETLASVPCSRLVSIGNTPAVNLLLDDLRKLGAKLSVPEYRSLSKLNLCHAIVSAKGQHDVEMANGTFEVIDLKTNSPTHFVTIRFLNVLFGEAVKPLLAQRGQILGRNQLEEKSKTDQNIWTTFIQEYNSDQEIYGENTFPSLEFNQDTKDF